MYKMVYSMINNNTNDIFYYLLQALFIAVGIALAIFLTDSIRELKLNSKWELYIFTPISFCTKLWYKILKIQNR